MSKGGRLLSHPEYAAFYTLLNFIRVCTSRYNQRGLTTEAPFPGLPGLTLLSLMLHRMWLVLWPKKWLVLLVYAYLGFRAFSNSCGSGSFACRSPPPVFLGGGPPAGVLFVLGSP